MCTARVWYRTCVNIPLFLPFQRSLSHVFLMSTYFLMIYFIIYCISYICGYLFLLHCWPLSLITLVTSLIPSVAAENTVPLFPLSSQSEKPPTSSPLACPPSPEDRSHQLEPTTRGGCSIGFYLALIYPYLI